MQIHRVKGPDAATQSTISTNMPSDKERAKIRKKTTLELQLSIEIQYHLFMSRTLSTHKKCFMGCFVNQELCINEIWFYRYLYEHIQLSIKSS